ncbi:hypothetical protein GXW83_05655 [Streptacidiphilus sp. PB12-B1b]|uniref:LpqB family beta-propeller domain-containing protein n=1 Tax=Streptacidiphilus sp. PB12-B1b TaxID=2705012 RepID=UPI0015FB063A|nr:LpqB family beta-propeller domain-containing protein [Streptacidiphilus sp. PB12-B1b]QMU75317.1 hypothetical protein GXW83_05655 [Streptacidiphilus sp. PB12-B1b]
MRVRLRRGSARTLGAMALGMVLAGCATMPDSGAPAPDAGSQDSSTQSTRLVVVAVPPQPGDGPADLLVGFLDDLVSDEADYTTAKEYLADPGSWNPAAQVMVLDHLHQDPVSGSPASGKMTFDVTGDLVATLNSQQDYTPGPSGPQKQVRERFSFVRNSKGNWQITDLPQGLIIRPTDFQRLYESVDLYYPGKNSTGGAGEPPLVANPVWVRIRIDPLRDAARALANGAPPWLGPVVSSAFPSGVSVDSVSTDGNGAAKVVLSSQDNALLDNRGRCDEAAAQMLATLGSVPDQQGSSSQQVRSAALYDHATGAEMCWTGTGNAYEPAQPPGDATAYFVDAAGRLDSLDVISGQAVPVPGQLEPAGLGIGAFAVAPGTSGRVAVVPRSGQDLYVGNLTGSSSSQRSALHAPPKSISSPSWDSTGTLWAVDSDPASHSPVVAVTDNGAVRVPVTVKGLAAGDTVAGLRVSDDGARIALIVDGAGSSTAEVGWVARSGTPAAPVMTVFGLHNVAQSLNSVQAVSWMDDDSVMVLGQSPTSAKALSVWEVDGSTALIPSPAAPQTTSGMTSIAALQSEPDLTKAPLLGDSNGDPTDSGRVYLWETGVNVWRKVRTEGAAADPGPMPSYPG